MKLKEILGVLAGLPKQASETVEQLQAMILAAEAERAAAITGVAEIAEMRLGLLKNDDEAALDQNDRQEQLHHRVIEKCDYALAELRPRLVEAQAARRLAQWNDLRERYRPAAESFHTRYAEAYERYLTLQALMHEAQESGFAEEARRAFHGELPWMIDATAQARWLADVMRRSADPASRPQREIPPRLTPPQPPRKPAPPEPPAKSRAVPLEKPKPRPPKLEVASEGETLVTVLRSGYESPISGQCILGDIIALPNPLAAMAVRAGAVEFHSLPAILNKEIGGSK